jgi:hypothetical protein
MYRIFAATYDLNHHSNGIRHMNGNTTRREQRGRGEGREVEQEVVDVERTPDPATC